MKVLVTPRSFGKTDPQAFAMLEDAGLKVVKNDTCGILDAAAMKALLTDCDGVVLGVDPMDAQVIAAAPQLKAISKYGVGVDNIDLDACKARGIQVSRAVGSNTQAVADFAFALMMAVARKVLPVDAACRQGNWTKMTTTDVYGKKLGIIGTGAIGQAVAKRAKGFDMTVLGYDVFWNDEAAGEIGIEKAGLEHIYRECDFISLHVPLTEETRHMISGRELAMMKPTAILVNTARGGIVDEDALLSALKEGRIYGAGIDAFAQEPPENKEWFTLDNVVLGSHAAASTVGAVQQMGRMAAANLIKDLQG